MSVFFTERGLFMFTQTLDSHSSTLTVTITVGFSSMGELPELNEMIPQANMFPSASRLSEHSEKCPGEDWNTWPGNGQDISWQF